MKPYVIMTDTTADLPEEYIKEYELEILSLGYTVDGEFYNRDNPMPAPEFYTKMRAGCMPTSVQVNPDQAKRAFEKCLEKGKDVLYIAFSSGLSDLPCCFSKFNSIRGRFRKIASTLFRFF